MLSVAKIHSQCKPPCAGKRGGKGRYLFFHPLHLAEKPKGSSISQFPLPHPSIAERTESALSNSEVYAGCSNCTCLAITSWCAAMHKSWDGVEQILLRYTHTILEGHRDESQWNNSTQNPRPCQAVSSCDRDEGNTPDASTITSVLTIALQPVIAPFLLKITPLIKWH